MPADPAIFDEVPLFALLDADERTVLAQSVETRTFAVNQIVYQAGDAGGRAYVVQRGRMRVSVIDDADEELVLHIAGPGELVGMSSMLAESEHMTTAIALEETCAIEIDREDLKTLLLKKPLAGLDMLTMVEKHVRASQELLRSRVVRNPEVEIEAAETLGDRMADAVAKFGGSWAFVIAFGVTLFVYVTINVLLFGNAWDPYPFILLNLFLSMLAAIQAPVIMMSQNRQDSKDRVRSELDYQVNLKAEAEIMQLLERVGKLDERLTDLASRKVG